MTQLENGTVAVAQCVVLNVNLINLTLAYESVYGKFSKILTVFEVVTIRE